MTGRFFGFRDSLMRVGVHAGVVAASPSDARVSRAKSRRAFQRMACHLRQAESRGTAVSTLHDLCPRWCGEIQA